MKNKIKFNEFIRSDVDAIVASANFTYDQKRIFDELCACRLNDAGIAQKLNLSESCYYKKKKAVISKIKRITNT